jgi:hypothetical protein
VGVIAVLALAGVAIFALAGGDAGPLGGLVDDEPPTPAFEFVAADPKAVETSSKPDREGALTAAEAPAAAVTDRLDELYTAAFLDPGNWLDGDYDEVLDFFSGDAREAAERQIDVLTAGPAAGEAFDTIEPRASRLKLLVLLDPTGVARSVEGSAKFTARGAGPGGLVSLVSRGEFIFAKTDGEWLVVSFSVQRSDEEREPKPGGSSSPGSSPSESPAEAESP